LKCVVFFPTQNQVNCTLSEQILNKVLALKYETFIVTFKKYYSLFAVQLKCICTKSFWE